MDYRSCADGELLAAIGRGDQAAAREYFERFAPRLTRLARNMGAPLFDAEEIVDDVLADSIVLLTQAGRRAPGSLATYLDGAVRNRVRNWRRGEKRRAEYESDDEADVEALSGGAGSFCSEGSLRASAGPDQDETSLPRALRRLVSALDEGVSTEERLLLAWVSNVVPQREIAAWLGATYDGTGRRIRRLAERLLEIAERYAEALTEEDWRELEPFFRRAAGRQGATSRMSAWRERVHTARAQRREQREVTGE